MKHFFRFIIVLLLLAGAVAALIYGAKQYYPQRYTEYIQKYCEEYDVPQTLVYSVIKCESNYDPTAQSDIGARGLMQLTPDTFEWVQGKMGVEVEDADALYDPETNIRAGVYLLSLNLTDFDSAEYALAAYHAGRTAVKKWIADGISEEDIPYSDTSAYVKKVMNTQKVYNSLY